MIKTQILTKYFGAVRAVEEATFEVQEGETLVLVGTSGCGKTTLLKMINRLIEPTRGTITIDGENIETLNVNDLRRNIGYVIQEVGLFPHYTIEENISVVPELLGWDSPKIGERVYNLLKQVQLNPDKYSESYPHQLSGGQQQRVGVARALAADPPIVLMDEPFGALDLITRQKIRQEFMQLDILQNKTILLVTHDVSEAFELGDRICLMDEGQIQQIGSAEKLLFEPDNDFVNRFFQGDRYELGVDVVKLQTLTEKKVSTIKQKPQTTFEAQQTLHKVINWYANQSKELTTPIGIQSKEESLTTHLGHLMSTYHTLIGKLSESSNHKS